MIYYAIAFIIACPMAYYIMDKWLQQFVYRIELSWWLFAIARCTAMVKALLTISGQNYTAARRNPVEAFRVTC